MIQIVFKCKVCGTGCCYPASDNLCSRHTKDPKRKKGRKKSGNKYGFKNQKSDDKFIELESYHGGYPGIKNHCVGKRTQ